MRAVIKLKLCFLLILENLGVLYAEDALVTVSF